MAPAWERRGPARRGTPAKRGRPHGAVPRGEPPRRSPPMRAPGAPPRPPGKPGADFGGPAGPHPGGSARAASDGAVPFACRKSSPAAIFSARCLRNVCAGGANSPPARQPGERRLGGLRAPKPRGAAAGTAPTGPPARAKKPPAAPAERAPGAQTPRPPGKAGRYELTLEGLRALQTCGKGLSAV